MKSIYKIFSIAVFALAAVSCSNDDDFTQIPTQQEPDFSGTYAQNDQMGRPAVNTVFVSSSSKDMFNTTIPTDQNAAFQQLLDIALLCL